MTVLKQPSDSFWTGPCFAQIRPGVTPRECHDLLMELAGIARPDPTAPADTSAEREQIEAVIQRIAARIGVTAEIATAPGGELHTQIVDELSEWNAEYLDKPTSHAAEWRETYQSLLP